MKCLIVDDEPLAHTILENYIQQIPLLQIVGKCYNAVEAFNFLYEYEVDVMFLDIQMPILTGLQMLKTLEKPPQIVLTTAYSEFALESYEFGVLDYLLKPIRFERFLKTINKLSLKEKNNANIPNSAIFNSSQTEPKITQITIKSDGAIHCLDVEEVIYVESYGNFVKIHTLQKILLVAETTQEMHNRLPAFVRVHKSFLLNLDFLDKIENNILILKNNESLPLGNSYKQAVLEKLKK